MAKLIQTAYQQGQKDFNGWVIGRARHCLHSRSEPAFCEPILKKVVPGYVLLEITIYDAGCLPYQSLKVCLVDVNVLRSTGNIKEARCMSRRLTMIFFPEGLKSFPSVFGDTNPIHYGPNTVVPGLWILSRLEELYGSRKPVETPSIRFLHPVRAGSSVHLAHKNDMITEAVGGTTYFTMTIHSPDQA